jgi:undecaprenyl-diphosphatase
VDLLAVVVLALIQGVAELLPVSSSAHVIIAEKLMHLDPTAPEMTFVLVMLHTGTMLAVVAYFWKRWMRWAGTARPMVAALIVATACTGTLGLAAKVLIERVILGRVMHQSNAEIESLFGSLPIIAASLFAVGILIIATRVLTPRGSSDRDDVTAVGTRTAVAIGLVQGLALPFRGFSRSGATISTALLRGVPRGVAEDFSFALAALLTPPVITLELRRLLAAGAPGYGLALTHGVGVGVVGMASSFGAGLLALRWLSTWLERGRWHYFGYYCIVMAAAVAIAWRAGL